MNLYIGKFENLVQNSAVLYSFLFLFYNNTNTTSFLRKKKLKRIFITCWVNDAISIKQKLEAQNAKRRSIHRFGQQLLMVLDFLLRSLHYTGIKTPFSFRSPPLAPSVSGSGSVGVLVLVGLVGFSEDLHSPSYNANVKPRLLAPGDLVLRKVLGTAKNPAWGKL